MSNKTPEEMEAEVWAEVDRQREALREKAREARLRSTKEPFDFQRLRELYAPIAEFPRETLDDSEAEEIEQKYYLFWDEVTTLPQLAEFLVYLARNDST